MGNGFEQLMQSPYNFSKDALELGLQFGFKCAYCDLDLLANIQNYDVWQNDHLIPRSLGGPDDIDNLVLACKHCNFVKGAFDPRYGQGDAPSRDQLIKSAREYIKNQTNGKQTTLDGIRKILKGGGWKFNT